jgi:hypothetical protein
LTQSDHSFIRDAVATLRIRAISVAHGYSGPFGFLLDDGELAVLHVGGLADKIATRTSCTGRRDAEHA